MKEKITKMTKTQPMDLPMGDNSHDKLTYGAWCEAEARAISQERDMSGTLINSYKKGIGEAYVHYEVRHGITWCRIDKRMA